MNDKLNTHMDMLDNASPMLLADYPNRMTESCHWAAAQIRSLEAENAALRKQAETAKGR